MLKNINRKLYIIVGIAIILTAYFSYVMFKYPYVGILLEKTERGMEVVEIDPLTWGSIHLKTGDFILSVDNKPPLENNSVYNWNALEQFDKIEIIRDGIIHKFESYVELDTQMVFQLIIPVIFIALTIFLSNLITKDTLKSNKEGKSALYLILFLFSIALAYISAGASARGDVLGRFSVIFFMSLVPITYLQYIYHYFKEVNSKWFSLSWIKTMYLIMSVNVIAMGVKLLKVIELDATHVKMFNLLSFLILFVITYYFIARGHRKTLYKSQKYLLRVILISNLLAILPFIVLYVVPYIIFRVQVFSAAILSGFLLIIPLSLVYQYMATKIYDIEYFIGRLKYYSLLSIVPALIGLILIITSKTNNPTVYSVRVFLFLYILTIVTFYFKETMDFKFKFNRFSEKHNYHHSLMKYTEKLRRAEDTSQVFRELSGKLIKYLLINKVYLVKVDSHSKEVVYTDNDLISKKYLNEILKSIHHVGTTVEIDKGFILYVGESNGLKYITVGIVPTNTPKLTRDEVEWLESLAYFTNVTLESFTKIDSLVKHLETLQKNEEDKPEWLNRILLDLEEKQRSELARDLHDSVLQDLVSIKRQCEMLKTNYLNMDDISIRYEASNVIENIDNTIDITRKTCHELRPQILFDLGLDKALKKLSKDYQIEDCEIKITTSNLHSELMDKELQMNIYRICQELLNNARKHSKANHIKLIVVKIKEKFVIHYEDDGVGANPRELRKQGSMGLSGMEERVRLLRGTVDYKTSPNEGFIAIIEI